MRSRNISDALASSLCEAVSMYPIYAKPMLDVCAETRQALFATPCYGYLNGFCMRRSFVAGFLMRSLHSYSTLLSSRLDLLYQPGPWRGPFRAVSLSLMQARYAVVLHAKQCHSSWLFYAKPSQLCHSCFSKPNASSVRSSVACEAVSWPSKPWYASNLSRAMAGFLTRSPSVVLHAKQLALLCEARHSYATLPLGTAVPAPTLAWSILSCFSKPKAM
jgi:hypothetical protein